MTALATESDLTARIGALTVAQQARVAALLEDASCEVRDFCGQEISQVVGDQQILSCHGLRIILPQRPVTAVTAVELVDGAAFITVSGWAWDGRDEIDLIGATVASAPTYDGATFRVTYTHGYPAGQIPNAVLRTVCGMVNRTLTAPSLVEGLTGESIGEYSYQLQQGAGAAGTSVTLNGADERRLTRAGFRRASGSVFVRSR